MDGKVFKMADYQIGVTAPPFHPWCRCCTAPYFEDMEGLGERWARSPDGTTAKVPGDMSFEEWRQKFVQPQPDNRLSEIFRPMGDYIRPDGSFDLNAALEDYEKFLQTVPEKNRMYLKAAMDGVEYQQRKLKRSPFGYSKTDDAILFDPSHPMFAGYDFLVTNTHELGHRVDYTMFIHSWEDVDFSSAIAKGQAIIAATPEKFLAFAQNDSDGFLSDILSAICEDNYRFPAYHEQSYWLEQGNKEKEIFANLFSLETFGDNPTLEFLRKSFPEVWNVYSDFWK